MHFALTVRAKSGARCSTFAVVIGLPYIPRVYSVWLSQLHTGLFPTHHHAGLTLQFFVDRFIDNDPMARIYEGLTKNDYSIVIGDKIFVLP